MAFGTEYETKMKNYLTSPGISINRAIIVILIVVVLILIGGCTGQRQKLKECADEEDCFVLAANSCLPANYTFNDYLGKVYLESWSNCTYTRKMVSVDEDAPAIKRVLDGKSMTCQYERNAFKREWLQDAALGIDRCRGKLKNELVDFTPSLANYTLTPEDLLFAEKPPFPEDLLFEEKPPLIVDCEPANFTFEDLIRNEKAEKRFKITADLEHDKITLKFKHYTVFLLGRDSKVPTCLIENLENAGKFQQIIPRVLGFAPEVTDVPIYLISQERINQIVKQIGSDVTNVRGLYTPDCDVTPQGCIMLSKDIFHEGDSAFNLLLHETTHFYTHQMTPEIPGEFDEGVAFYITHLAAILVLNGYYLDTFVEEWGPYKEELWKSYAKGQNIEEYDTYSGGYIPVIINAQKQGGSVKNLFQNLMDSNQYSVEIKKAPRPSIPDEKFNKIVGFTGEYLTPCKLPTYAEFEKCFDKIIGAKEIIAPAEIIVPAGSTVTMMSGKMFSEVYGEDIDFQAAFNWGNN